MFTGNDAGIPLVVHIAYQMMFAIITPALITGAFANRVTFKAYFLFLTPFVYFPSSYTGRCGAWMASWRSGAALGGGGHRRPRLGRVCGPRACSTSARRSIIDGRRTLRDRAGHWACSGSDGTGSTRAPNCALTRSPPAPSSTPISRRRSRPSHGCSSNGCVGASRSSSGCSPVPSPAWRRSLPPATLRSTAVIIGIAAGVVCYFAVTLKNQLGWDDALDARGVHGVGGFLEFLPARRLRLDALESQRRRWFTSRQSILLLQAKSSPPRSNCGDDLLVEEGWIAAK